VIGLPAPTGFNSSAELLETAHKLFLQTSIIPIQKFLIRELTPIIELVNPDLDVKLEIKQNTAI
jgi:hypothetical protein